MPNFLWQQIRQRLKFNQLPSTLLVVNGMFRNSIITQTTVAILAASVLLLASIFSTSAYALPVLQLGPDPSDPSAWNYDTSSQTWVMLTHLTLAFQLPRW